MAAVGSRLLRQDQAVDGCATANSVAQLFTDIGQVTPPLFAGSGQADRESSIEQRAEVAADQEAQLWVCFEELAKFLPGLFQYVGRLRLDQVNYL